MLTKSKSSTLVAQTETLEHLWYWTNATLEKGSSGNYFLTLKGPKFATFKTIRLSYRENTKDPIPVPVYDVIVNSLSDDYTVVNETYSIVDSVKVSSPNNEGIVSVDLCGMQPDTNATWKTRRIRLNIQTR
jgi:hypothetical protein